MKNKLKNAIPGTAIIVSIIWLFYRRLSNPDMTDIRFIIEYWHEFLIVIFVCGISIYFDDK